MATEPLVIEARMRDELSQPARAAKREVRELGAAAERTGRQAGGAGAGGLRRMETASERLHRAAGRAHNRLKILSAGLSRELAQGARRGAIALGVLVTAVAAFGLKAASGFQQARIAFDTLLGSAEKGKALFAELQALNLKTPFELGEIAPATQLLLRYGIAADKVVPTLKSLLDAAALSGAPSENLQRLALAVGQIQQKGRVAGEEARQLAEAGIDAYGLMAEKLGITTAAARKLGEQGRLSAEVFMEGLIALDGPLAKLRGGAEKMSQTLLGQFSNLKDAISVRLADSAAPLVDRLSGMIPEITSLVGEAVDRLGPPVFDLVGLLVNGLAKFLPIVAPLLATVVDGLGRLLTAAGPALEGLSPLADELGAGLIQLVDALVPVMPDLVDLLIALVGILPDMIRLLADLVPLAAGVARLATALIGFGPVRGILAGVLTVMLGYRALSGVIGTIRAFATALGLVGTQARFAASAPPIGAAGNVGLAARAGGLLKGLGIGTAVTLAAANINALGNIGGHIRENGFSLRNPFASREGDKSNLELARDLFTGDVKGSLASSARVHAVAAGRTGGRTQVTSSLRDYAVASSSSGHRRGTAWDVRADNPHAYAGNIRAMGGFAAVHDQGSGRHVHAQIGDVTPAPWSPGRPGGGEDGGMPPVIIRIDRVYGQVDFEEGVARGYDLHRRRRRERSHRDEVG